MAKLFSIQSFSLVLYLLTLGQQVHAYAVADQQTVADQQEIADEKVAEESAAAPAKAGCVNSTEVVEDDEQRSFFLPFISLLGGTCNTTSGMQGSCLKSGDCTRASGTSSGSCANGLGVCCMISLSCGTSATYNGTLFANSGTVSAGTCTFTIPKSSNVCQIRLDFKTFTLSQPSTTDQTCTQDQFIVSGASNPVPAICGENAGQHMYLDSKPNTSSWTLTVTTSGTSTVTRQWSIAVSQLPCASTYLAPDQCLQYYTGATGTIKSFNFVFTAAPAASPNAPPGGGGKQLSNQDYTMCIRTEDGFCSVTYTVCTDTANTGGVSSAFTISLQFSSDNTATNPYNIIDNGGGADNCIFDWLEIPRGQNTISSSSTSPSSLVTFDRFCGTALGFLIQNPSTGNQASVPVTSYRRPFELYYHTNAVEGSQTDLTGTAAPDIANHGFCLNYSQNPCGI